MFSYLTFVLFDETFDPPSSWTLSRGSVADAPAGLLRRGLIVVDSDKRRFQNRKIIVKEASEMEERDFLLTAECINEECCKSVEFQVSDSFLFGPAVQDTHSLCLGTNLLVRKASSLIYTTVQSRSHHRGGGDQSTATGKKKVSFPGIELPLLSFIESRSFAPRPLPFFIRYTGGRKDFGYAIPSVNGRE